MPTQAVEKKRDTPQHHSLCPSTEGAYPSARLKQPFLEWVREGVVTSSSAGPVRGYHPWKNFEILDANSCFLSRCQSENVIIRPYIARTTNVYVDAVSPSSMVCRSACHTLESPAKTDEPIEMPFGLRIPVGPWNHVLDGVPTPQMGRGNSEGGKGRPFVKYILPSAVQKSLNRSIRRLHCGLRWAEAKAQVQ